MGKEKNTLLAALDVISAAEDATDKIKTLIQVVYEKMQVEGTEQEKAYYLLNGNNDMLNLLSLAIDQLNVLGDDVSIAYSHVEEIRQKAKGGNE